MVNEAHQEKRPVAIVTGGNSGIGEAIVHLLTRRGYAVAVSGRRETENQRVAQSATKDGMGEAWAFAADVSREEDCLRLIRETQE